MMQMLCCAGGTVLPLSIARGLPQHTSEEEHREEPQNRKEKGSTVSTE